MGLTGGKGIHRETDRWMDASEGDSAAGTVALSVLPGEVPPQAPKCPLAITPCTPTVLSTTWETVKSAAAER